jgi:hypothetical protein
MKTKRTPTIPSSNREISKENKGGFHNNIQWDIVGMSTVNNSSNTISNPLFKSTVKVLPTIKIMQKGSTMKGFGRKENVNSMSAGTNNKSSRLNMILCEATTSTSGARNSNCQRMRDIKKNKDQHQIPRKKVKVSSQQQQLTLKNEERVQLLSTVVKNKFSESFPIFFDTTPLTTTTIIDPKTLKSDYKLFGQLTPANSLDIQVPCCSHSITTGKGSSISTTNNYFLQTQTNKVTAFQKEAKSMFSKLTWVRQAKKFGTGESSRLKKKRTMKKTDANLKRN